MTEAVFDFAAINRRLNRKPEPIVAVAVNDDFERAKNCIFGNLDCPVCNPMAALRAEVEQMERDIDSRTVASIQEAASHKLAGQDWTIVETFFSSDWNEG